MLIDSVRMSMRNAGEMGTSTSDVMTEIVRSTETGIRRKHLNVGKSQTAN